MTKWRNFPSQRNLSWTTLIVLVPRPSTYRTPLRVTRLILPSVIKTCKILQAKPPSCPKLMSPPLTTPLSSNRACAQILTCSTPPMKLTWPKRKEAGSRQPKNNQRKSKLSKLFNWHRELKKDEKSKKSKSTGEKVYLIKESKKVKFEQSETLDEFRLTNKKKEYL